MRRVVVTGLGMLTPLGCGVEPTWRRIVAGESGARKLENLRCFRFAVPDRCDRSAQRLAPTATTIPTNGWSRRNSARSTSSSSMRCAPPRRRSQDSGWKPESYEDQTRTGVMIGSGIGGIDGIAETAIVLKEKGPRRVSPFFIPGRLINLASGYVSIEHGLQGSQPRGRHRLLNRRACDRRCGAADRARRCRRDARGRHGIADQPHQHGGICRLPRALDHLQRHAGARPRGPTTATATAS